VTTDALLEARRMLTRLYDGAADAAAQAGLAAGAASCLVGAPAALLARAGRELEDAAREAHTLVGALWLAAEAYGLAEQAATARQELYARLLGPGLALGEVVRAFAANAFEHGGVVFDDPRLVLALRELADSIALPLLVAAVAAAPGPLLDETDVRVRLARPPDVAAAPQGFTGLADRIPASETGDPQLRVERYDQPDGSRHWIVYATGTVDWGIVPGTEPWDDTSNVVGAAGGSAGSTRAALDALRAAGWRPGEPVLPVGHSQGGIVATGIAVSGVAPVPMLVTFGSPTAGAPVPGGVTDVAVEHSDDPVPALGGSPPPFDASRLVVREAAPAAQPAGGLPAHALTGYRATAERMDEASDPRLVAARDQLRAYTGDRPGEVTMWRADRVPGRPRPLSAGPPGAG
jgi:hypothetical protein